jgi:ribosomal protein S18 acetylase RimI-like enzyme
VSSFAVRPATPQDAPAILELWRLSGALPSHTDNEEGILTLVSRDPKALLVAESEGKLIGSLIAGFDGSRGTFFRLVVLPKQRRSGLGRVLVTAGERSSKERGAVRVSLYAIKSELATAGFWSAVGYEDDDRLRRYVENL